MGGGWRPEQLTAMQKKTMIIVGALVVTIAGAMLAIGGYNREPEGAGDKKEVAEVSAAALHAAFLGDETAANTKYVGTSEQAIRVSGAVRSIEAPEGGKVTVVLETADPMAGVVCEFDQASVPTTWTVGDTVTLKGICTGINDLIPDVILVRCAAME